MTVGSPQPLSFRPERSGVEKSHSEMGQAALWWEISRLRVSIEYKTFTLIPTCRPARNDSRGGAAPVPFCFFLKCLYTARSPCHFDRSEVEKSHSEMGQAALWWEISRLRVSIEYKTFTLIPTCRPARNDSRAGSTCAILFLSEMPVHSPPPLSFRPERSGEISLRNSTRPIVVGDFRAQSINRK